MKLVFEYSQEDGAIDSLAARAAFEAALNSAGIKCEMDWNRGQTVMRSLGKPVEMENARFQNTLCNVKLTFDE